MKKPLTKTIKTFYGIGDLFSTLGVNVEIYLFTFFLTNIAQFKLTTVAMIGSITSLSTVFLSLFYGVLFLGQRL